MFSDYENMSKEGLKEELQIKKQALININKEIEENKQIIKGYFDSIITQKELYNRYCQKFNNVDNLKWKILIINKARNLELLKEAKKDIEEHITAIEENLKTYDVRMNKKFGRKSPFIVLDFGYNAEFKIR